MEKTILWGKVYKGNLGFEEMVQLFQKASSSQIEKLSKVVEAGDWEGYSRMVRDILGVELIKAAESPKVKVAKRRKRRRRSKTFPPMEEKKFTPILHEQKPKELRPKGKPTNIFRDAGGQTPSGHGLGVMGAEKGKKVKVKDTKKVGDNAKKKAEISKRIADFLYPSRKYPSMVKYLYR